MAGRRGMAQARIQEDLQPFQLHEVPPSSWMLLSEDGKALADLDLGEAPLPSVASLKALLRSLHAAREERGGGALWDWLSRPASADEGAQSRLRALLVAVAKLASGPPLSTQAVAGTMYLTLLAVEGSQGSWGTLFQPLVFQRVLCALRPLRTEKRGARGDAASRSQEQAAGEGDEAAGDAPEEGAPQAEASELLSSLVTLLEARPSHSLQEGAAMVVDALSALCSFPASEAVAQSAAAGLAALVAGADGPQERRRVACTVLRSILPAILMTQDRAVHSQPSIPKPVLQSRLVALGLARQMVQSHPELLVPCSSMPGADGAASDDDVAPACEDAADVAEAGAKRRRQLGKGEDDPILSLVQLLCVSGPERAEFRALAAEAALALVVDAAAKRSAQQPEPRSAIGQATDVAGRFLAFLERLSGCERASYRGMAVELASLSLEQGGALAGEGVEDRLRLDRWLLRLLARRCSDAAPGVRCRAIGGVASALEALPTYPEGAQLLRGSMAADAPEDQRLDLPDIFRAAATDEKAWVRKAALGLLEKWLRAPAEELGFAEDAKAGHLPFQLLGQLAGDESVMVRKASVSSLAALLRASQLPEVCKLWADSVLPLAVDAEGAVVERALEEIDAAILAPLAHIGQGLPAAGGRSRGCREKAVMPLLPPVLGSLVAELTEHLQRAVQCFAVRKRGSLLPPLARALAAVVRESLLAPLSSWPTAVWSLLEELTSSEVWERLDEEGALPGLVVDAWEHLQALGPGASEAETSPPGVQILSVLEQVGDRLPRIQAEGLVSSLCEKVSSMTVPMEQIRAALRVIGSFEGSKSVRNVDVAKWRTSLLKGVEADVVEQARAGAESAGDCGRLFLLGELALAQGASIASKTVVALQSVATGASVPATTRAHAFAALGKVCLRQEALAKRSVELFAVHLDEKQPFAVRNNVLVVLSDLCVQYTSLVDRFVLCMADLLRDGNLLLRRQSAMVLASLLSENYVKFRGPLVHRFLFSLSDPVSSIRQLVECIFVKILHRRNTALFVQSFTDAICALNGWSGHPSYQGAVGNEKFCLLAEPQRRVTVYRFMLAQMTHEQKFNVCSQLVTGFLAAFVDADERQRLELPQTEAEPKGQALGDVLALLGCKEMRVCFSPKLIDQEADQAAEGEGPAAAAAGSASGVGADTVQGALSGLMKQVVRENIAPVLVQMKEFMEVQRSPFLGRLRRCLCEMLREFKDDLRDMLGGDARLADEIAFDLGLPRRSAGSEAEAAPPSVGGEGEPDRKAPGRFRPLRRPGRLSLGSALPGLAAPSPGGESALCSASDVGIGTPGEAPVRGASRRRLRRAASASADSQAPASEVEADDAAAMGQPARRGRLRRAASASAEPETPASAGGSAASKLRDDVLFPEVQAEARPGPPCSPARRQVATPQAPSSASSARRGSGVGLLTTVLGRPSTPQREEPASAPRGARRSVGRQAAGGRKRAAPETLESPAGAGAKRASKVRREVMSGAATLAHRAGQTGLAAEAAEQPSTPRSGGLLGLVAALRGTPTDKRA